MLSVLHHQVTLHPLLISKNWNNYKRAYKEIEALLPTYHEVPNPFIYECDILLGLILPKVPDSKVALPLERLFRSKNTYLLEHDKNTYSRGMEYYPGLRRHISEQEKLSAIYSNIYEILSAYMEHAKISTNDIYVTIAEDYIRNYLLILYQAFRSLSFKYIFLKESSFEFELINDKFRSCLQSTITILFTHLTDRMSSASLPTRDIVSLCKLSKKTVDRLTEQQHTLVSKEQKSIVRESREVDSLRHIYLFALMIEKQRMSPTTCLIGIEYGGLELPFAVNAVRILNNKQELQTVSVRSSHYSSNSKQTVSVTDLVLFNHEQRIIHSAKSCWILDDSTTTGRSFARICESMPKHIKNVYISSATFKVSHRYHHLVMDNHGGLNPIIARNSIILCKSNYAATYKQNSYVNRKGRFNINKDSLYKILGQQHG